MTDAQGRLSLPAVRQCAQVIHSLAPISPDGFANLRFAALANVPPGTPFFPAAYHLAGDHSAALSAPLPWPPRRLTWLCRLLLRQPALQRRARTW